MIYKIQVPFINAKYQNKWGMFNSNFCLHSMQPLKVNTDAAFIG